MMSRSRARALFGRWLFFSQPMQNLSITIRPYQSRDLPELARLFYRTVHEINARDYSPDQLNVWASGQIDTERWDRSLRGHLSLIALVGDTIAGFGDIDLSGYLDRLYVHADYQSQGIGTALCDRLEAAVSGDITTHASITARGFFEKRGYRVLRAQQVNLSGVLLTNFVMVRQRPTAAP